MFGVALLVGKRAKDSRPSGVVRLGFALLIALRVPLLAGLIGLFNGFRMMRLPDIKPSASIEGAALG